MRLSLCDIIAPIPIFNSSNKTVSWFASACRRVQKLISRQEEAEVTNLLTIMWASIRGAERPNIQEYHAINRQIKSLNQGNANYLTTR